jgi:hypothetical protein
MTRRHIFWLWFPLALSMTFMMLEGPAVQGAIARLEGPALNLAAFGFVLSIQLILESPVIMLVSTAIALATDAQSYRALRQFVLWLTVGLTLLVAAVAWTPLFDLVGGGVLGMPAPIVAAGRPAMQIMLFWIAAIGWRRFYQGILVRYGQTKYVSLGTALRLASEVTVAVGLAVWGRVSGASVGALALMVGVTVEAGVIYLMVRGCVRENLLSKTTSASPLTLKTILRFHLPLAATSLLALVAQPMTSAALARLAMPRNTLAAWPVVFSTLLVMRGWGMALQETTIAQAKDPRALAPLRGFTLLVAAATSGATALLAFTPLIDLYLRSVLGLAPELVGLARAGVQLALLLPALTAMSSWLRGLLAAAGSTEGVYWGMLINLVTNAVALVVGVTLRLPGVPVAALGLTLAMAMEFLYLQHRAAASLQQAPSNLGRGWSLRRQAVVEQPLQHVD